MENLDRNDIVSKYQKMNRVRKVTSDYAKEVLTREPLLVTFDKNSHLLVLVKGTPADEREMIRCHMLCKNNAGLCFPLVGVLGYTTGKDSDFKIEEVAVANEMMSQGIGKILIQFAENIALESGKESVVVDSLLNRTEFAETANRPKTVDDIIFDNNENYFDKNLFIYATLGYGTDWDRQGVSEASIPLRKDNLAKNDLRFGLDKSRTAELDPHSQEFKLSQFHNFFNAQRDIDVVFEDNKIIKSAEPIVFVPTKEGLLSYEKMLSKDLSSLHPEFRKFFNK